MIELKGISVNFDAGKGKVDAVDNVSLTIREGQIFGIVGSSGAGKSTLVRTINLLQKPTSGSVIIDGRVVFSGDRKEEDQSFLTHFIKVLRSAKEFLFHTFLHGINKIFERDSDQQKSDQELEFIRSEREQLRKVRLGIGMIFQHFNLIQSKTVFDNVAFAMEAANKPKAEIQQRVTELLDLVGLADKHHVYPVKLSGGQKQRVGIARALANNPRILLCDEPTSALDLETTQSILTLLKDINRKYGITIVVITHEMDVVKTICDQVAVMSLGKVVEQGDVYDIFARPQHNLTKQLIKHTMNLELPQQLFEEAQGTLLKIVYQGSTAVDPVISDTAQLYEVKIAILHGKIEYIGDKPIGVLVVNIHGERGEIQKAAAYIGQKSAYTEVLYA